MKTLTNKYTFYSPLKLYYCHYASIGTEYIEGFNIVKSCYLFVVTIQTISCSLLFIFYLSLVSCLRFFSSSFLQLFAYCRFSFYFFFIHLKKLKAAKIFTAWLSRLRTICWWKAALKGTGSCRKKEAESVDFLTIKSCWTCFNCSFPTIFEFCIVWCYELFLKC